MDKTYGLIYTMWTVFLGATIGVLWSNTTRKSNYIPKTDDAQTGFTIPSKLEIKLTDEDGIPGKETILKYDGKQYWLKLDKDGQPYIQKYIIKPAEAVPVE